MPTWIFTATSRIGARVDLVSGAPFDSIAVYDEDDLNARIAAARTDPRDLIVDVERLD
ncbi:hypothetical protein [Streptomyces mirabilis]|uniref:hypothetical protein n=1 Tax=Streptomyces mirabilis TaxID=68239 RepID=UPI0036B438B4